MTEKVNMQTLEYGDYQTPEYFAEQICEYIKEDIKIEPKVLIEPTFGLGNFILACLKKFKSIEKVFGIEINEDYYIYTKEKVIDSFKGDKNHRQIDLFNEDIFTFNFDKIKSNVDKEEPLLIIGNPPWATNAKLTTVGSSNLPIKKNFKGLKGLDAITGKGNFDIAEYIILQLLNEFKEYKNCYVAMLCKNIVGRNIVRDLDKYHFLLSDIKMLNFDATSVFGVNCEACLLVMKIGGQKKIICDVHDFSNPKRKIRSFGWVDNNFISNIEYYTKDIDGKSQLEWRQGIKHDCAKVMELSPTENHGIYTNGHKQKVDIEDTYVYPLIKSSDIKNYIITDEKTRKRIIVTQKRVGEETNGIIKTSPKLWKYLEHNSKYLDNRKSSIYKNAPRFAIFGVGDYSFKPYKVGISGFYKEPIFTLAFNEKQLDKPIMFDDTCYFIGFDKYNDALITTIILNSHIVQKFLKSIAFIDSKRPYTKEILMRINFKKITDKIDYKKLLKIASVLNISTNTLTPKDYQAYRKHLNKREIKQCSMF